MELSNYVLGIHSNVTPNAGFADGHAWITITTKVGKGRFVKSYGLWPDGHPRTKDNGDKTDVRIGMEPVVGLANRYYALTHLQHMQLMKLINTTEHWFYTNNCSSWSSEIVKQVFRTEIDADDWLGVETPRELSRSIQILEHNEPTAVDSPKIVVWRLTRRGYRRAKP
jgi:prepilin-type processing-associated H-X9-DG protein